MTTEFMLTVLLPPSVNNLYVGTGKRRCRTPKYTAWASEVGWRINEARANGLYRPLPAERWYWTDISLPANHLGDSDNRLKALHDLLHEIGCTPDDKWLLGGTYMRCADVAPGTCRVRALSLTETPEGSLAEISMLAQRIVAATTSQA